MDGFNGGFIAVNKLIEDGCRKIFGIFKSDDRQGLQRYAGFQEGIIESGLDLGNTEVRWFTTEDVIDHGMTMDGMLSVLKKKDIDGIVCYNDQVASAIIRDLTKNGVKIPILVSFDNSYLCETSAVPFLSLGHRKEELGSVAAAKLKSMIEGNAEKSEFLDWIMNN
ncbi:MAG: substrate-binding domain-containing protein [Spirochaetales bacterium]